MIDPTTGPADQGNALNDSFDETSNDYMNREVPEPDPARSALVNRWQSKIQAAKKHFQADFKQMREDQDFLAGDQWPGEIDKKNKYIANITQRHVQQRVAALYAKDPKATVRRRTTMDFTLWDERAATLMAAQQMMQAAQQQGMPLPPQLQALLADVAQGVQKRNLYDRIARTMEIVFQYSISEQNPPFKSQMKQLVRRVCACGIGYLKIGYQRVMEKRPEDVEKITDITQQMATLERLIADSQDGEITDLQAEAEQLRLLLEDMQNRPQVIVKEGLVFDFPRSNQIIIDPRCSNIRGFVGAQWVAQEFILDINDIKEIYKVDIKKSYQPYINVNSSPTVEIAQEKDRERNMCCVWEIYNKADGLVYVIAEGYKDFLKEPAEPEIKLERFWPFFPLSFNDVENDRKIYPQSDVALIRPQQKEYNRARQALREHRIANRPKMAVAAGMLDEGDVEKLQTHPANAVITLNALQPGAHVEDVLQVIKTPGIDPNLYDTELIFTDIQRVSGSQEANLGGTGNGTATEASISETSRVSSLQSNVDDLDDMLCEVARTAGQILLMEMAPETVTKIAGPGASWPTLTANDVAQELFLEVEAGSSGRPNKAIELANFEKIAPTLLQIPGIDPMWLAKEAIRRMDDKLDTTDAITDSMQSIVAMNAAKQVSTGNPQSDPNLQGPQGGNNALPAPQAPQPTPALPHGNF